jgi:hypothetical protein
MRFSVVFAAALAASADAAVLRARQGGDGKFTIPIFQYAYFEYGSLKIVLLAAGIHSQISRKHLQGGGSIS